MSDLPTLIEDDLDICFLDWGTEITLRGVSQTFDPETQAISESFNDTTVQAIVGHSMMEPAKGTAQGAAVNEQTFFIRDADYPFSEEVNNARLVYGGTQYDILNATTSATDLKMLECRRHVRG